MRSDQSSMSPTLRGTEKTDASSVADLFQKETWSMERKRHGVWKERDMEYGKFVHLLPNGDITDSQELDGKIPDNHDLGWWQVGCTCYKNFLKAAHTKPVKTWMVENGYAE